MRIRTLALFHEQWLGNQPIGELERMSLLFDIGEIHALGYARVKRLFDIVLAVVGLVALAAVIPFVIVGDLLANRGPLLYRQPRIGRGGTTFSIVKFRTMRTCSDEEASDWTKVHDARITPFGNVMRRTHLDELPQVVNILRGELSFVGPRPEQPQVVAELTGKIPYYGLRHLVRPGLTGWAQVKYQYAGTDAETLEKLQYEFFYLRRQSLSLDIRIVFRTARHRAGAQGPMTVRVDVVVLTWNDGELLRDAVASAAGQAGLDAVVLVVDNASEVPASVSVSGVQLVRNQENLGVGGGRNLGVRAMDSPFVCFLDSDARLHPDALARLVGPMLDDPSIGLTAPVFTGQRPEASAGRAPTLRRKLARALNRTDLYEPAAHQGAGALWDVDFAIGACQVFRRVAFDAVGGLDDSASFGPEDVDFCLRLRAAGWRVVQVADAGCDHPPRRAFKGLASARGRRHAVAVLRHLWRHRHVDPREVVA